MNCSYCECDDENSSTLHIVVERQNVVIDMLLCDDCVKRICTLYFKAIFTIYDPIPIQLKR